MVMITHLNIINLQEQLENQADEGPTQGPWDI